MVRPDVGFIGGDVSMAVNSLVCTAFSDAAFTPPDPSLPWSIGALLEAHADCAGFVWMPRRQRGLAERDQGPQTLVIMPLWATNVPKNRSLFRSDEARTSCVLRAAGKNEGKAPASVPQTVRRLCWFHS